MKSFEVELQNLTNREFILPTHSGSAAIVTALIASGIPAGSEVIMPSVCCPAVLFAINLAGFHAILADVCTEDFCMDVSNIKDVTSEKTKAIIAVHAYGRYCKIQEIQEFSQVNNLLLIEDACLGLGGTIRNTPFGSFGDVSIFSFGHDKIIDAGGGGALLTNDTVLFEKCRKFLKKNHFFSYDNAIQNTHYINERLKALPEIVKQRNQNAYLYHQHLEEKNVFKLNYSKDIVYWRYSALSKKNRTLLVEKAKENGIIITTHYKGLHQFRTGETLTNSEMISNQIINLFVKPETSIEQIHNTIAYINNFDENS